MRSYFLGMTYPLYGQIVKNGITFDLNQKLHRMNITNNYATGGITGFFISPVLYFFDVLKIRKQKSESRRVFFRLIRFGTRKAVCSYK